MQEIWRSPDVAGNPDLSVDRVYPKGAIIEFKGSGYTIGMGTDRETKRGLNLKADEIRVMKIKLGSQTEDGRPLLEIKVYGDQKIIFAVGDFSPLLPHIILADPLALQKMTVPSGQVEGGAARPAVDKPSLPEGHKLIA